jgi:hypothetical protein
MADSMSDPMTHCPWCSVVLPAPDVETCPSCGAALTAAPGSPTEIKGVTTLDTEAILRARSELSRPRGNRLLSFITGEIPVDTSTPADAEVFAPPPEDVRREMRRLELEAQRADLVAETVALKADELARLGIHVSELPGDEAVAAPETEPATAPPASEGVAEEAIGDAAAESPQAGPAVADPAAAPATAPEGGWPAALTPEAADTGPAPENAPTEPEPESRS